MDDALPNLVINLDHVAFREGVQVCDIAATQLGAESLDAAVFSLSLMGNNWTDYLKEAYWTLRPYGHLFLAEPLQRREQRQGDWQAAIEAAGFRLVGEITQRYEFLYATAVKE